MHFMKQWLRWPVPRIAAVLAVLGGLAACDVNAVPRQDEAVKAAWSQVLNQYQRRSDLIPNLVETLHSDPPTPEVVLAG
jgi:LemA protein